VSVCFTDFVPLLALFVVVVRRYVHEQLPEDSSWPIAVTVGGAECVDVARMSDSELRCRAPRNYGVGLPVVVFTPLQSSVSGPTITYSAPMVYDVEAAGGRPIDGGFTIVITGKVRGCGSEFVTVRQ
jgi:hypothetical protein